jgi:AcrR family transcriptional regulator
MTEDTAGGPPRGALEADMPTLIPGTTVDRSGPGPNRRLLGRDQILREAVRLIDQEGRDRLTMRRLGSELGVEAMALYRYIPGREQLLDGVVEYVMNELYQKTMKDEELPGSWQEYLQQMAHGVRDIAAAHPRVFPLVATRPPAAPWLRPPLRSLRWVEGFLVSLQRFGFTDTKSVGIYRAFSTFLLGHLLLESATLDLGAEDELDDDIEFFETNDLSKYPRLMALAEQLKDDGHGAEFEDALEDLLDRIELVFD